MQRLHPITLLLVAALFCGLTACKIRIEVPPGGSITTQSGNYSCPENTSCDVDVVDIFFDETFLAVPVDGYQFDGWIKRPRGLFGGSLNGARIATFSFEGNDVLESFLASSQVFYLTPSFSFCGENCGSSTSMWLITETVDGSACGEGIYEESFSINMSHRGNRLTVQATAGTFMGTINGNTLVWSGSYPEDGGTTNLSLHATLSANSFSGSTSWTWTGDGFSCSGTSQFTGTRTGGNGPHIGGPMNGPGGYGT